MSLKRILFEVVVVVVGVKSTEQSRPPDIGGGQKRDLEKILSGTQDWCLTRHQPASVMLRFKLGHGYAISSLNLQNSSILTFNIHSFIVNT